MPLKTHAKNSDGTFGPTLRARMYLPKSDHRPASRAVKKTKWRVNEAEEFDVFFQCDDNYFYCAKNKCFFGVIDKGSVILGIDGERIAKFPQTQNSTDPWHGYPVTVSEIWNRPCDCMLEAWEMMGIISSTTRRRIERGWI